MFTVAVVRRIMLRECSNLYTIVKGCGVSASIASFFFISLMCRLVIKCLEFVFDVLGS